jgi:hypothetical protein
LPIKAKYERLGRGWGNNDLMDRRNQLIHKLRSLAHNEDTVPNKDRVVSLVETNPREIIEIFGSYKEWCDAAGLRGIRGHAQKWTINDIEAALKRASVELNGHLAFENYQKWHQRPRNVDSTPAASTIKRIMDSCWADSLKYFGLIPLRSKSRPLLTEKDLKKSLLGVTGGEYMSMREYDRERDRDMPSATTIAHWYGGWPKAFRSVCK